MRQQRGRSAGADGGKPRGTPYLPPFCLVQAPRWILGPVSRGVGVHEPHVVDTVCPLLTEVTDKQAALLFRDLRRLHYCVVCFSACPGWRSLRPLHGLTWIYEGVVTNVGGGEGFACQVCYPATELVVTRRDEAALFVVKGVTDGELGLTAITVCWEFRGIEAIPQEEGVKPFLCPQFRPIDYGRLHCKPGPGLCRLLQSMCV